MYSSSSTVAIFFVSGESGHNRSHRADSSTSDRPSSAGRVTGGNPQLPIVLVSRGGPGAGHRVEFNSRGRSVSRGGSLKAPVFSGSRPSGLGGQFDTWD